jgi:preprotein translocase subunit SecB
MKPAPIQLLQVVFKKVQIEWDERHAPQEPPNPFTTIFVFDGVDISTEFSIGDVDPDHERGRMYLVTLRVIVDNESAAERSHAKFSPYLIDVEARGVVVIPNGAEKLAPPEDLAAVNGASLLWSALREQVSSVTSRMLAGPVMLPTMNFHDLRERADSVEPTAPAARNKMSRKTRSLSGKARAK